jgi:hypothetical protein
MSRFAERFRAILHNATNHDFAVDRNSNTRVTSTVNNIARSRGRAAETAAANGQGGYARGNLTCRAPKQLRDERP